MHAADENAWCSQEMCRACKPDGQILLLEHGMGTSPWINQMLHNGADKHLKHWGCQWDRDIESIVKQVGSQNCFA